jgi:amidohydrolase
MQNARRPETRGNQLLAAAISMLPDLQQIRQHFHQHPELSYEEFETAARCAELLREYGYSVRTGIAKTGLIADLGDSGPMVVVRADMDALPIQTVLQTPYASCQPNKMHACGHDAHMAMALGAARLLAQRLQSGALTNGRLRFLFQPAEETADREGKTGARRMVEEGALAGAKAVIAQHGMPDIPAGQVAILDGPVMGASTPFEIVIRGGGGHIAEPERTIDTILIASEIRVKAIESLNRRGLHKSALIGFGSFEGDTQAFNIVPKQVTLRGSIRSFSEATQDVCKKLLEQLCARACKKRAGTFELRFLGNTPVTENDPAVASVMRQAAGAVLGSHSVIDTHPRFAAEDFAWYKRSAPSAFMLIGTGTKDYPTQLHAANYDVPDRVLAIGAAILAETTIRLLG